MFGMNGFVIGPLLAALFVAFWGIFMREFNAPQIILKDDSFAEEESARDRE
jgi:predicted PurR-regulated permease PerM